MTFPKTRAFATETLTVSDAVKTLTAATYRQTTAGGLVVEAVEALVSIDGTAGTNDLRYTLEGTDPVAETTGHLAQAKTSFWLTGIGDIEAFKAIREGAADAVIQVTYFREA